MALHVKVALSAFIVFGNVFLKHCYCYSWFSQAVANGSLCPCIIIERPEEDYSSIEIKQIWKKMARKVRVRGESSGENVWIAFSHMSAIHN